MPADLQRRIIGNSWSSFQSEWGGKGSMRERDLPWKRHCQPEIMWLRSWITIPCGIVM